MCDHETGEWRPVEKQPSRDGEGHVVTGLSAGHTYSFKMDGGKLDAHCLPCVTIPHETRWQQEQFERRYQQLNIVGRGRTAVVRQARDRGTGQRVALKQVERRRVPQLITRAEYNHLTALNHPGVLRGLAFFENAPSLGVDTIVMELVESKDVVSHACSLASVSEAHIREVTRQLLSVLEYLQLHKIVHCDIKPDNLLVESHGGQFQLKVVDFGSARTLSETDPSPHYAPPPNLSLDLEFAAPELLSESPCLALTSDVWSCAVLVYVLISGVSPFLDDCPEETTANILKADFSFLPELFPTSSVEVQEFLSRLLTRDPASRPLAQTALSLPWLQQVSSGFDICPSHLATFLRRRKPQCLSQDFTL